MFTKSAAIYDAIYSWKDYAAESRKLHALIQQHAPSVCTTMLDVACGTGHHMAYLREHYQVEGLDLEADLLDVARERNPGLVFHQRDMVDFDLGKPYDVIVCLFSAIGYVKTVPRLNAAIASMARHLRPGGLLMVEPWFAPDQFRPAGIFARFVDDPELKIARMNKGHVEGTISYLDFHYLVGTPEGVEYYTETHALGLFTHEEQVAAFEAAGLRVVHDAEGIDGRGLYIGSKP
jgi:SAM-dependent methyltransferase